MKNKQNNIIYFITNIYIYKCNLQNINTVYNFSHFMKNIFINKYTIVIIIFYIYIIYNKKCRRIILLKELIILYDKYYLNNIWENKIYIIFVIIKY